MSRHRRSVKESVKLVFCILPFLLILAFSFLYFAEIGMFDDKNSDMNVKFSKLVNSDNYDEREIFQNDLFLPEFIGLCRDSRQRKGIVGNVDAVSEVFYELLPQLFSVIDTGKIEISDTNAWIDAANGECVYIRFFNSVQLSFIGAATDYFNSYPNLEFDPSVKELVISFSDEDGAKLYLRSPLGSVFRMDAGNGIILSPEELLSKIGESNLYDFEFVFEIDGELDAFSQTQPLVLGAMRRMGIEISLYDCDWQRPSESELLRSIIGYYGFNVDKLNSYTENDALISLASHGSLRLTANTFSYTAYEGEGIELEDYLDYIPSSVLNLGDEYRAIMLIANKTVELLDGVLLDASLSLDSVYLTDSGIRAEFAYSYSNMQIVGDGIGAVIETSNGKLIKAEFSFFSAKMRAYPKSIYSGKWLAVSKLSQLGKTDRYVYLEMSPVYYVEEGKSDVVPDWKVKGFR